MRKPAFKLSRGFTLIELLVVIGILGILAAALVATIDPFEQLKKASDANLKNAATEFLNANTRYFTTHNGMPWDTAASGGNTTCNTDSGAGAAGDLPSGANTKAVKDIQSCSTALINDGELKSGFTTFRDLDKIFVVEPDPVTSNQNNVVVCFWPQSKSQRASPEVTSNKYNRDGSVNATQTCTSNAWNNGCYWCTK